MAVALALTLALLVLGCGPNAAVQVAAQATSVPTPACTPAAAMSVVARPVAVTQVRAVSQFTAVLVARFGTGGGPTPSPVSREQRVREAIGTATAEARPATPSPAGTPTPNARKPPTTYAMCASPVTSPGTGSTLIQVTPPPPSLVAVPALPRPSPGVPIFLPVGSPMPVQTLVSPNVLLASDINSLVQLRVGDRFVLLLGDYAGATEWQVQLTNQGVLTRVGEAGQGEYQAVGKGQTQLQVAANPACLKSRPPCLAVSRMYRFTITVD